MSMLGVTGGRHVAGMGARVHERLCWRAPAQTDVSLSEGEFV